MELVNAIGVLDHILSFCGQLVQKVGEIMLIWLATVWALWSMRNDVIFNSMEFQVVEVIHRVKLLSSLWNVIGPAEHNNCNFVLWTHWPLDFLNY